MFVSGQDFNRGFYRDVVAPIVTPWPHEAALIGWGSDVLGYDTDRSTDHGWGPRLTVFTDEVEPVRRALDEQLPDSYLGWPVGWDDTEVRHHVTVATLSGWFTEQLGVDPVDGLTTRDWLVLQQQRLLEVTGGAVYADPHGQLAARRDVLRWYPDQVWLWLMACQWTRIGQEQAFVGRTAEVGDELGSALIASRLVHDVARLFFVQRRTYAPYTKWFGTAFSRLDDAAGLEPALRQAVAATTYAERERSLVAAYEFIARAHNELGVTEPVDPRIEPYYSRPFLVLHGNFTAACLDRVTDPELLALPRIGAIDQWADSTDVAAVTARLSAAYG